MIPDISVSEWETVFEGRFKHGMEVRRDYRPDLGRIVLYPQKPIDHLLVKCAAKMLQAHLIRHIHPSVYGYVSKRGSGKVIYKIREQRKKGRLVLRADFSDAFLSVDRFRLFKLIRRSELKPEFFFPRLLLNGKEIHYTGIPQGFPWSPILFSVYISPVIHRLNIKYRSIIYADDLFVFLRSSSEFADAFAYLQFCISKHSQSDHKLTLSTKERKRPKIFEPHEEMPLLGIILKCDQVLPDPKKRTQEYYHQTLCTQKKIERIQSEQFYSGL